MTAPFYLGDVVHHRVDEHGPIDVVDESGGKLRSLHFGSSARQSTMFVQRPEALALEYTRCMTVSLPLRAAAPARVALLGLGGGSLAKFLLHHCPHCQIDVAELRRAVVDTARSHFALPVTDRRLLIHVGDGRLFLEAAPNPYDLLLLDLHTSHGMAPEVTAPGFFALCRQRTAAGGVLAANLWYGVDKAAERRVRDSLEAAFERVLYLPVAGKRNCIAFGLTGPAPPRATLAARAADWQERTEVDLPELLAQLGDRNPLG